MIEKNMSQIVRKFVYYSLSTITYSDHWLFIIENESNILTESKYFARSFCKLFKYCWNSLN